MKRPSLAAPLALAFAAYSLNLPMPSEAQPIPTTIAPITWPEVIALPPPQPGQRIAYGSEPQQFGFFRQPAASTPAPVAVLIHGGCWLNQFDLGYFEHWAQWLTERGFATWNIEYRRLGDPGAGWPGTLQDVARGIDHLRELAQTHALDLSRIVVIGHSAGGQLALWSAGRMALPTDSAVFEPAPLPVHTVVGLAPITDLQTYRIGPDNSCHASVDPLMGGGPEQYADRYATASPAEQLPLKTEMILVSGSEDGIVNPETVRNFATRARAAGDSATFVELPGAGHFDTGVPTPASAAAMSQALQLR